MQIKSVHITPIEINGVHFYDREDSQRRIAMDDNEFDKNKSQIRRENQHSLWDKNVETN